MAKKDKKVEGPLDLAARIGGRNAPDQRAPAPPPAEPAQPQRHDGPLPPRRESAARPAMIGMDEPAPPLTVSPPPSALTDPSEDPTGGAIPSVRTPPAPGEIDVVVTPLPTPDDWHRFEIALRRVRGVTQLRPEYYRHGVAKMRVMWEGSERLSQTLRTGIAGYRIRVIGEDRSTIQLLVSSENEERRPG